MSKPFDPRCPYAVYTNGELAGEYVSLDREDVEEFGSGVQAYNEIEVWYKGELVRTLTTDGGIIVEEWVAEGYDPASSLSQSKEGGNG